MGKIKVIVSALLFVGSCISLVATHGIISALLESYGPTPLLASADHASTFTSLAQSVMPRSAVLCFGALLVALTILVVVLRTQPREFKLYWTTVLSSINYYLSAFLLSIVLIGYFLLPKLANGI